MFLIRSARNAYRAPHALLSYSKVSSKVSDKDHEGRWNKRKKMILPSFVDLSPPTVEEAVDNILYNNPISPPTKVKKHTVFYFSKIIVELSGI
jgi:hypothetical protein